MRRKGDERSPGPGRRFHPAHRLLYGEPQLVLGRREPRHFSRLFPTVRGVAELYDLDDLLASAAPLLRAFDEPVDFVSLRRTADPTEIVPGLVLTPPEAYFEMWLLSQFNYLAFEHLRETGGFATLTNVKTTSKGRRWLYEFDAQAVQRADELQAERIAATRATPWIIAGEYAVDESGKFATYRSNLGNGGQGVAEKVSLHLVDGDGDEVLVVPIPNLGAPSVLVSVVLPVGHPTLSARVVWDDGTGPSNEATFPDVYRALS